MMEAYMKNEKLLVVILCIFFGGCAIEVRNEDILTTSTSMLIESCTPTPEVSSTFTQEPVFPTLEVTDTPSPTLETPLCIQTPQSSLEPQEQKLITEEELITLLYMSKAEVFDTLGEGYEYNPLAPYIYYYENIGIGFEFLEDDSVLYISIINESITINGVKRSMSLEEIASILGEGFRVKDDTQGTYSVFYPFEKYTIHVYAFGTDKESQKYKDLSIMPIRNDVK
jgi:hypothetical protein